MSVIMTKDQINSLNKALLLALDDENKSNTISFAANDDGVTCLADHSGYYPLIQFTEDFTEYEDCFAFLSSFEEGEIKDMIYDGEDAGFWNVLWDYTK